MNSDSLIDAARTLHGAPLQKTSFPFSSIGLLLAHRVSQYSERPWLVFYESNGSRSQMTFAAFYKDVVRVALYLRSIGVQPGDRVATLAHNHSDTVVQYFAVWFIGATLVPVNATEDDERIRFILQNAHVKVLFVRDEYVARVESLAVGASQTIRIVYVGTGRSGLSWDRMDHIMSANVPDDAAPYADALDHECLVVYTSGTTGNPKGVSLTHGNMLSDARGISSWHGIDDATTMMCVLPIHHVNGTVVTLVTPLFAGASVVLCRKFQTDRFFPCIAQESVNIVSVVPTLLAFLLEGAVDTNPADLRSLRHIICGAGPLTCELAERFERRFRIPIIHGYGLSETTCYSCFLPLDLSPEEHEHWMFAHGFPSIGVAIPENEMDIHSAEGVSMQERDRGEIVIRGHTVMTGYYGNDQANAAAFTHGWFRSGDEGFFVADAAGRRFYFITGRIKELIIRGGVNISPLEIDEVLNAHPGVDAAIAVAFENNWYGEEVGAYVRRRSHDVTSEDILEWCREHLPPFKSPKVVVFGDDIPVTATGKYQRNKVRHLFAAYRDIQFH